MDLSVLPNQSNPIQHSALESLNLCSSFKLQSLKAKRNLPEITLRVQALRSLIFRIELNWKLVSFICWGFSLPPCVLSRQETINAAEITANVHAGYLLGPSSTIFNSYCQDKNYCPVLSLAGCKSRIHILHRLKFFFLTFMNYLTLAKIGMAIVRAMEPFCLIANALIFAASPMPPMPPLTCCTCARFGQLQRFDCIDARALRTFLRHLRHHWRRGTSYPRHYWQERHFVTNLMPFFAKNIILILVFIMINTSCSDLTLLTMIVTMTSFFYFHPNHNSRHHHYNHGHY